MSSLQIEERFSVNAPIERVWRFLLDPEQIAPCLPGAELLQVENERTFHGQMKVKVGPVTVAYQGTIELTDVDEAGRRVQMVGKGKEKGGAGSAKMTMESRLEAQPDGAVAIAVTSDVELAGRIVRFGRGMIQSVSAQLFKQFAANVRQALEGAGAGEGAAAASEAAAPATAAEPAPAAPEEAARESDTGVAARASEPAAEATPSPAAADAPATGAADAASSAEPAAERTPEPAAAPAPSATHETAASEPRATAATPAAAQVSEPAAAPRATQAPQARTGRELAPREAEPVRALPLLFRALWDVIAGFFKRLLGRSR